MARQAKPWFRKGRGWYVQRDGQQVFLSKDKKDAQQKFHELMLEKPKKTIRSDSVAALIEGFSLQWLSDPTALADPGGQPDWDLPLRAVTSLVDSLTEPVLEHP